MALKRDYLVEKRNVLNELRSNNMTLQELRFFSIYLAKINARDPSTRLVRFPLTDFERILGLDEHIKIDYLKSVTDSLLCKIVHVPIGDKGGYTAFQLFKECTVKEDEPGSWYVEIDAHDKALPLMFEFKARYFSYELWNALKLKSSNQLRMYEILKQYELVGERIIAVDDLKSLLGIDLKDYDRYDNLKTHVLNVCQKSLAQNTDISFTYEPVGKKGRGGKILTLKFKITKNSGYVDQLSLEDFISQREMDGELIGEMAVTDADKDNYFELEVYPFISEACDNEFSPAEIQVLYDLAIRAVPYTSSKNKMLQVYNYLKRKYDELKWRASKTKIKSRMGYLKKIIEADVEV